MTEPVMGGIVTGSVSVAGAPRQEGPAAGGVVCGGQIGVRGVDTGIDDAHGGAFAGGGRARAVLPTEVPLLGLEGIAWKQ